MIGKREGCHLEPRLAAVEELVPERSVVADVGTDHALLAVRLVESGRAARCIATEPRLERLSKAARNVSASPARDRIELRSGSGLEPVAMGDRVTVIVIAGLGGHAIRRILDGPRLAALAPGRLVLQPQTAPAVVRAFLVAAGYRVVDERLVLDRGRFYAVVAAEPGAEHLRHPSLSREDLLEAGPRLVLSGSEIVARYWRGELERSRRILDRAAGARPGRGRDAALRRAALAGRVLRAIGETATGPVARSSAGR